MSSETAHIRAFRSSQKLASIYTSMGYFERAEKVRACGKAYSFYVCHDCGSYCYLQEFHCDDRLCSLCARARVKKLLEAYGMALRDLKGARMVTVSMRSRPAGELKYAVKELWDAFTRLRHRAVWKSVRGAIVSLEITWNAKHHSWHPHLHVLVDSQFIDWYRLRGAWSAVTLGEGSSVYIQRCRAGWERELIKYVTKVSSLFKSPEALGEFLRFARGKRFIRTYGNLYNCAVNREETHETPVCRECGAALHLERSCVSIYDAYAVDRERFKNSVMVAEECCCKSP